MNPWRLLMLAGGFMIGGSLYPRVDPALIMAGVAMALAGMRGDSERSGGDD